MEVSAQFRHPAALTSVKEPRYTMNKARWCPGPVYRHWEREKTFALAGNQTMSVVQSVA
jgi:hypothetical protein